MTNQIIIGFLAGGQARRLGGIDKCLIEILNKPILSWQLEKTDQFPIRIINANGDLDRFTNFNLTIVPDFIDGFLGPLSGILSLMKYSQKYFSSAEWMLSCATDAPFIPSNLGEALFKHANKSKADIVMATSNGRRHPVFCLWKLNLAEKLEEALIKNKTRKIELFTAKNYTSYVDFSATPDPFFNINTKQDVLKARELAVLSKKANQITRFCNKS